MDSCSFFVVVMTTDRVLVFGSKCCVSVCANILISDTFLDWLDLCRAATKSLFAYPYLLHCARIIGALVAVVWNARFVFDVLVHLLKTGFRVLVEGFTNQKSGKAL